MKAETKSDVKSYLPIPVGGASARFAASHVAVLAAFAGEGILHGNYIQIEANPSGGVDLFSTNGWSMCWVHDKSGRIDKAEVLRFTIPVGFAESCVERVGPLVCGENGETFPAPLPDWVQPGTVTLYCMGGDGPVGEADPGLLLLVTSKEEAPEEYRDCGIFLASSVFNERVIRSGELRLLAGEKSFARPIDFRGVMSQLGICIAASSSFNPELLGLLGALPASTQVSLLDPSGALHARCDLPEDQGCIQVSIMPLREPGR